MATNAQDDQTPKQTVHAAPSLMNWVLLTLVMASVIVAILTLLGPAVGNTFSNIVVGI